MHSDADYTVGSTRLFPYTQIAQHVTEVLEYRMHFITCNLRGQACFFYRIPLLPLDFFLGVTAVVSLIT